jgi:deoxyribonuclease V
VSIHWPDTIGKARTLQESLARKVSIVPLRREPRTVAGVDVHYARGRAVAAVCLYEWPGLEPIGDAVADVACDFPYVPGYLSFREGPAVVKVLNKLGRRPGLLFFDGQGIAHPRGLGIASHLGVVLGIPSVGCAKSRLVGEYEEPGPQKGSRSGLFFKNEQVGVVLRTRTGVRPVFVSPGHLIDIPGSVEVILAALGRFRLPEPLRKAHNMAKNAKKVL